jgi:hypothetical protein
MPPIEPLKEGHPYKLVVMSVDFVGSTSLKLRIGESKAERLLSDWQAHMFRILDIYHGHRVAWGGDGGVLVFEGEYRIENALHASLHALHYPLARYVRPLLDGEPGHIRVALHHGVIQWANDPGTINSKEIDLVCKLEKEECQIDSLLVSDAYFRECGQALQKLFSPGSEARGCMLYWTSLAASSRIAGSFDPDRNTVVAKTSSAVRPHPHSNVRAFVSNITTYGLLRNSTYITKFELENLLADDLAWIRLQANYYDDEQDLMGSRIINLGQRDSVKILLPAGRREIWTFNKNLHIQPSPGQHIWSPQDSEVYEKAMKAELIVLDVQATRKP